VPDAGPAPAPTATATPTVVTTPPATPTTQPAPPSKPVPACCASNPSQWVALKFSKSGTYAVRRTGKFGVAVDLPLRADLTITVATRRNANAKSQTLLKATRKGVAAGKRTFTLTLGKRARASLRKGQTVTLTVTARHPEGFSTIGRATAKVR